MKNTCDNTQDIEPSPVFAYHYDYRGSTVAMTDQNGNVVLTAEYDIYGDLTELTGDRRLIFGYNGRDGVQTDSNGLLYMRARYYCPKRRRFINADILHGNISDSSTLNRYAYVNGNPVSFVDPFGLWSLKGAYNKAKKWVKKEWIEPAKEFVKEEIVEPIKDWAEKNEERIEKIAIGVGTVVAGAAVVAATAATGGTATVFVTAVGAGLKAAALSGAIGATVGAGTSAIAYRASTGGWEGAGSFVMESAIDEFCDGFMIGGITSGTGMTIGAIGKASYGFQIGQTQKPQYGKLNLGYGTPKTNGYTAISFQDGAGKRIFSLDFDAVNAVHMHLPNVLPKVHIPIGAIASGIYSGLNMEGNSRK